MTRCSSTRAATTSSTRLEREQILLGQDRSRERGGAQRGDVAEATATLLQIRFEQEGHVPDASVTLTSRISERVEPLLPVRTPLIECALREVGGEVSLARDAPRGQQPHRGLEVPSRDAERFGDGLDPMIERHARVPDRVPDAPRQIGHVPPAPMHEDDVDVARGRELAPAVATYGDESAVRCIAEELGQVRISQRGVCPRERAASELLVGEQLLTPLAEAVRARRRPSPPFARG